MRLRQVSGLSLICALQATAACTSSSAPPTPAKDAAASDGMTGDARADANWDAGGDAGALVDASAASDGASSDADAGNSAGDSGANGDAASDGTAPSPTVVATFSRPPSGLAIAGDTLYVTTAQDSSTPGTYDGMVLAVPKTATGASLDAGASVLATGLRQAGAVAVAGGQVYFYANDPASNAPGLYSVSTTGGAATQLLSGAPSGLGWLTRLVIANGSFYGVDDDLSTLIAWPLGSPATSVATLYTTSGAYGIYGGVDTDGTNVFFFGQGAGGIPTIDALPVDGGAPTILAGPDAGSGEVSNSALAFLVTDGTSVYWAGSQPSGLAAVYAVPKGGGAVSTAWASDDNNSWPQFAIDGTNLYVLETTALVRVPKAGGPKTVLASTASRAYGSTGAEWVQALAFDDTFVYWLDWDGAEGKVLKTTK